MAVATDEVCGLAETITKTWQLRYKSLPQSGLGMMKLRDGAMNEPFYLGEIPVSSAWVELTLPDGVVVEGAAQVMTDNQDLAEAIAVCDAILANELPEHEQVIALLEQGAELIAKETQNRKHMLERTRVDFSLLDATGDDDEKN